MTAQWSIAFTEPCVGLSESLRRSRINPKGKVNKSSFPLPLKLRLFPSSSLGLNLLKSTPSAQLATAIRTLHQGHCQLGSTIAPKVFVQLHPPAIKQNPNYHLSERESEVLRLISQGKNNREIAQILYLTEGTVKNYVTQILGRLGLRDV